MQTDDMARAKHRNRVLVDGLASSTAPPPQRQGSRINSKLSWWLVAVVALAPLPLASNRPIFWAATALAVGVIASVYGIALSRTGRPLRIVLPRDLLIAIPFLIVAGFLVIQMLPLEQILGPARFLSASGATVESSTLSIAPGETWLMLLRLASYALFFFLMLQVAANGQRAERLLVATFVIIVGYAVLSLVMLTQLGDTLLFIDKLAYKGDATATFVNRNSFATFLAFGTVIGTVLLMRSRAPEPADGDQVPEPSGTWYATIAIAVGLVFVVAALLATRSRMGLFAALTGTVISLLLGAIRFRHLGAKWIFVGLGTVVAGVATLFLLDGGVLERVVSIEGSADERGALYAQVLQMIKARPWLGYGGGSFESAYPLFHQLPVDIDAIVDHAHSSYLTLWVELGVVVGTIPMLMVFIAGVAAVRRYWSSAAHWATPLAAAGVIVVAAVHSTVDFSLEIEANVYMFLAVVAIGLARIGSAEGGFWRVRARTKP
jgi:O-antigen ligase